MNARDARTLAALNAAFDAAPGTLSYAGFRAVGVHPSTIARLEGAGMLARFDYANGAHWGLTDSGRVVRSRLEG